MSDSSYVIQIDPPSIAVNRTMLDLNNGPISVGTSGSSGTSIDWGTADFTPYEGQQGVWGQAPVDGIYPNRTITINLLLGADETGDEEAARSDLQQKVALLQREGGQLMRQRQGGPRMYADITYATLVIPDEWGESGEVEPDVQLVITALPDFYSDEIALDQVHCTGFCDAVLKLSGSQAVIEGDYPARCRILYTTGSGSPIEEIMWGFRSRHYSNASTAALLLPASGFALGSGVSLTTLSGSQNAQVAQGSFGTTASEFIDTSSPLTHLGTYAVWVRAYTNSADGELSAAWKPNGLGNIIPIAPVSFPIVDQWCLLNLGVVTLGTPPVGTNGWTLEIYGQSSSGTATLTLDEIMFQPLDEAAGVVTNGASYAGVTEIRSDGIWAQTSTGSAYGPGVGIGDLPRVPPSGLEGRAVELLVRPISGPTAGEDQTLEPFTAQVIYRATYLSRP